MFSGTVYNSLTVLYLYKNIRLLTVYQHTSYPDFLEHRYHPSHPLLQKMDRISSAPYSHKYLELILINNESDTKQNTTKTTNRARCLSHEMPE